jgi:hypothetical protein
MRLHLYWIIFATLGCTDYLTPEVGPAFTEACVDADGDPARAVSYARDVVPLWQRDQAGCVGCHTPGGVTPIGFERDGLDMSTLQTLRAGGASYGTAIIVAGEPCASGLVEKLGPAPALDARMPQNGPPFLSTAERQLVKDWIFEGALDN